LQRTARSAIADPDLVFVSTATACEAETKASFITLILDVGGHLGWIAKQVGHTSSKMIFERYYCYITTYQSDNGQKFLERVSNSTMKMFKQFPKSTPSSKKGNQRNH
jgi:hypothetical protein